MSDVEEIVSAAAGSGYDMSLVGLFMQASFAVKFVVILLIGCSFWSWTIIFAKFSFLRKIKASANKFEEAFWNCGSIENFFDSLSNKGEDPFISVFISGMQEWRRAKTKIKSTLGSISLNERITRMMRVTIGREVEIFT